MNQPDKYTESLAAFRHLLEIMDELREKCPWDREQTFDTLRNLTVEETFELADAILEKDYPDMCKELGDLLLHIVFYSKIASEQNLFEVKDVINQLCDKLIRRHPHIYGEVKADSANQVHENWEKIKLQTEGNRSVLGGIPSGMPAITKAYRIQDKVSGVGFDWDNRDQVWDKVQEELVTPIPTKPISKRSLVTCSSQLSTTLALSTFIPKMPWKKPTANSCAASNFSNNMLRPTDVLLQICPWLKWMFIGRGRRRNWEVSG